MSIQKVLLVLAVSVLAGHLNLVWAQSSKVALVSEKNLSSEQTIIVLGDSLSEGYGVAKEAAWPAVIEKLLNQQMSSGSTKKWVVVNAGVSGSTTASGIGRIKWLAKRNPQVLILALGANDGLRGLKVAESQKHLDETIRFALQQNIKVVLGGLLMPPNYGKEYTAEFKKMYEVLAAKHKVIFVPFVLDKVAGNPKYNLADGIHPNEEGHRLMAENIFKVIKGKL